MPMDSSASASASEAPTSGSASRERGGAGLPQERWSSLPHSEPSALRTGYSECTECTEWCTATSGPQGPAESGCRRSIALSSAAMITVEEPSTGSSLPARDTIERPLPTIAPAAPAAKTSARERRRCPPWSSSLFSVLSGSRENRKGRPPPPATGRRYPG